MVKKKQILERGIKQEKVGGLNILRNLFKRSSEQVNRIDRRLRMAECGYGLRCYHQAMSKFSCMAMHGSWADRPCLSLLIAFRDIYVDVR